MEETTQEKGRDCAPKIPPYQEPIWLEWVIQSKNVSFEFEIRGSVTNHGWISVAEEMMPWKFDSEEDWGAAYFGVTPGKFADWASWANDGCQCRAFTKKGTRCRQVNHNGYYSDPKTFDPDVTPYCSYHKEPAKRGIYKPQKESVRSGYVYLMLAEGVDRYKIGLSRKPKERYSTISKQSPFPVSVIACYKVDDMIEAEKNWHQKFAEQRVHGEWFELSEDCVNEFVASAKGVGDEILPA